MPQVNLLIDALRNLLEIFFGLVVGNEETTKNNREDPLLSGVHIHVLNLVDHHGAVSLECHDRALAV